MYVKLCFIKINGSSITQIYKVEVMVQEYKNYKKIGEFKV